MVYDKLNKVHQWTVDVEQTVLPFSSGRGWICFSFSIFNSKLVSFKYFKSNTIYSTYWSFQKYNHYNRMDRMWWGGGAFDMNIIIVFLIYFSIFCSSGNIIRDFI